MFETILTTCVFAYSQLTLLLTDWIRGEELSVENILPKTLYYLPLISSFHLFQSVLYKYFPARKTLGPITKEGNRPEYNDNGFECWLLTAAIEILYLNSFTKQELASMYDQLPEFQKCLNIHGLIVSGILYLSFLFQKSKSNEPEYTGNHIIDFFKGVSLHPRNFFGDIKIVINSRFGMMLWGNIVILSLMASSSGNVQVSGFIQLIYITKFFFWEEGYTNTTDIANDRCGYYLLWGCICYVPCVYTSVSTYHFYHPQFVPVSFGLPYIFLGLSMILLNYLSDQVRLNIRKSLLDAYCKTDSIPDYPDHILAPYKTRDGKINTGILVTWGPYRYASSLNYLFEILSTLTWTFGGITPTHISCFTYVIYLTVLLVHRTYRIERKCSEKYKGSWDSYREVVKYRIVPYIF